MIPERSTVQRYWYTSRLFDVYAMLAIGIGAFFLRRRGYEMAPLVLGLVLGPLLDKSLRRGLVLSDGSIGPFFTRPIALAFALVTIFTILLYVPPFKAAVSRVRSAAGSALRDLFARRA
jgi:putative tricarboxylic transport membrane protein